MSETEQQRKDPRAPAYGRRIHAMHLPGQQTPDLYELMRERTRYFKEDAKGVETMSKIFEDMRDAAKLQRSIDIAADLIAAGKMTLEEIAQVCRLSLEKVRELAKEKSA